MSQLTPTGTTCSQFVNGTAETQSILNYSVSGGKVKNNVTPGVFFYWVIGDGASRQQQLYGHSNDHHGQLHRQVRLPQREQCV